jgi:hypothetical protein
VNSAKQLEFKLQSKDVSTIGINFKIEDAAEIADLTPFKFTV